MLIPGLQQFHPGQTEHFHVLEGTFRVILEGKVTEYKAGQKTSIPYEAFHTWCNASATERLRFEVRFDPPEYVREEMFLRNIMSKPG